MTAFRLLSTISHVQNIPGRENSTIAKTDPTQDNTISVVTNFGIGFVIFLCILILYDVLRYYVPGHVYYRSVATNNPANNDYDGEPLASPPHPRPMPLSWIYSTITYSEEDLVHSHGLDVAMYVRFLATQAKIFFTLTLLVATTLGPIYFTAKSPDLDLAITGTQGPAGIEKASLANVGPSSTRLWATLVFEIAVVAVILIFLYRDMVAYSIHRRAYRADNARNPSNFAILLMDIPQEDRNEATLYRKFDTIFPRNIVAVHPVRDAHHLLSLKTRYVSAVNKRQRAEHSVAASKASSARPSIPPASPAPSNPLSAVLPVDDITAVVSNINFDATPESSPEKPSEPSHAPSLSPEYASQHPYRDEDAIGSAHITLPVVAFSASTEFGVPEKAQIAAYSSDIPAVMPATAISPAATADADATSTDVIQAATVDTDQIEVNELDRSSAAEPPSRQSFEVTPSTSNASMVKRDNAVHAMMNSRRSRLSRPRTPAASPRLRALMRADSDHIEAYHRQENKARDVVVDVERDIEQSAPVTHAAFVVFRSKVAATCAISTPIFGNTGRYKVSRAPEPRAINWDRINISRYTTRLRQYTTFGVLTAMTLLWVVPSSFIQLLRNLEQLGEYLNSNMPWIKQLVDYNPVLARFLEGILPPLLLFLVLLVVPVVIRFIVSFERIADNVLAEARVRNFLFFFYVMSNFVYQVGFGSFLTFLPDVIENPRLLVLFLSVSVPSQSTFLMKYVVINSFLGSALGMLNMGRLLFRPIVMWRSKTDRDVIRANRSFADYPFAKMYALCMMISLISTVYSTIAPIINVVAFMYFSIAYLCAKQFLLYSHRPVFEGGGLLFRDAWTGILIGLYVHQVAMIGIFWLKRAAAPGILAILSLVFSMWFTLYCRRTFLAQVENGSLLEQARGGLEEAEEGVLVDDIIPNNFADMFVHPGLKPVEVLEDTKIDPVTAAVPEDMMDALSPVGRNRRQMDQERRNS